MMWYCEKTKRDLINDSIMKEADQLLSAEVPEDFVDNRRNE